MASLNNLHHTSSDIATMADIRIPHLPNEILYEIAGYVDDEDILNLRLSAKVFQSITADRFATTFFEDRVHRLSVKGVKALLEITQHPVLVRHIRTVIFGHDGKQRPAKYHHIFEQIFQNLATVGNDISLGLRRDCAYDQYHIGSFAASKNMVEFFEDKILDVAIRARVPMNNLVSDVRGVPQNRNSWYHSRPAWFLEILWRRVSKGVTGYSQFSGLQIKLSPRASDLSKPGRVLVELQSKQLEISHIDTLSLQFHFSKDFTGNLREIYLSSCDADCRFLRKLLKRSSLQLEHLSLYDIRMKIPPSRPSWTVSWTSLFAIQRNALTGLKSCKFGELWDIEGNLWLEGGDKTIEASTRAQVVTVLSNLANGIRTFELDG